MAGNSGTLKGRWLIKNQPLGTNASFLRDIDIFRTLFSLITLKYSFKFVYKLLNKILVAWGLDY